MSSWKEIAAALALVIAGCGGSANEPNYSFPDSLKTVDLHQRHYAPAQRLTEVRFLYRYEDV